MDHRLSTPGTPGPRMPAVFFGHGNPLNALADNDWTRAWTELGQTLSRPRAILMVSAHWYVPALAVTAMTAPRTIHDFGGFPPPLYAMQYPAPGAPWLAERVADLLAPQPVINDHEWGLDHGTWSVLCHVYPQADVPVIQLSLDTRLSPAQHMALARRLAPLRDEGVLIAGSGDLVHNLRAYTWSEPGPGPALPWAERFERLARSLIERGDFQPLVDYLDLGEDARLSAPTPEHYLPLLYVLAQHDEGETIRFPVAGFDGGSISMLAVQIG